MLAEVGAIAIKLACRAFTREFVGLERVLSFVADPFPWEEVDAPAAALADMPDLPLRVLPANPPGEGRIPLTMR
jgi:hypothetical protein